MIIKDLDGRRPRFVFALTLISPPVFSVGRAFAATQAQSDYVCENGFELFP